MSTIPHPARAGVVGAVTHDPLLLPGKRPVFNTFTIRGGQTLVVGSVLGRVAVDGKLVLSAFAAGDGSQYPFAVCQENISTFDEDGMPRDTQMSVLVEAFLNASALRFGAGHSLNTVKAAMEARGFHFRFPGYSG